MKNRSILARASASALLGVLLAYIAPKALAQHGDEKLPHYDSYHDVPWNDPSLENLTAEKFRTQKSYAIRETLKALVTPLGNIASLANPASASVLIPVLWKQLTDAEADYEEILEDQPELFSYLKMHSHRYTPKVENGLTAVNADHEFKGISDREFGFCWGFATQLRNFHSLAFYDKAASRNPEPEFYYRLINRINAGSATIIPGFANLREFSMVPEFELYMKLQSMRLWRERIARFSSLPIFLNGTEPMSKQETRDFIVDLQRRVLRGEMPKILFTARYSEKFEALWGLISGSKDIHASLVYDVSARPEGGFTIHLWDINFYAESLIREPKTLRVERDGTMHFDPWFDAHPDPVKVPGITPANSTELGKVMISPENDEETARMIHSLKYFCGKNSEKCADRKTF